MISAANKAPATASRNARARLLALWPLLLLLGAYVAIRSLFWNCSPIWDGAEFELTLLRANRLPFDLLNYSLDSHVCQAFFLILSLPYEWFKHDYYRFNLWLTLFCTLGIVAFYRLLGILTGRRTGALELALGAALFAFHPTILASMIHFTLDIGLVVFLLWFWLLLLEKRLWPAAVAGTLLMLTKEPAVVLLPIVMWFCFLWQPKCARGAWLRRHWPAAVVPYCAFAFILADKSFNDQPLFWNQLAGTPNKLLSNYAGLVFVLNFGWLLVLLWLGLVIWLLARRKGLAEVFANARLIGLILLLSIFFVFSSRPYSNPRYLLVPVVLMLLGVVHLVLSAVPSRGVRFSILLSLLALLGLEDAWTVDPLSRAFFGTFDFGRHSMLSICRRTGECGGIGRDQLVYNLEFLNFAQLTRKIIKDVRPKPDTFIICAPEAQWFLLPPLDSHTGKPTLDAENWFLPRYNDMLVDLGGCKFQITGKPYSLNDLPGELYFVEYPNVANQNQIKCLGTRYPHKTEKIYDLDGYQLSVIHFME